MEQSPDSNHPSSRGALKDSSSHLGTGLESKGISIDKSGEEKAAAFKVFQSPKIPVYLDLGWNPG